MRKLGFITRGKAGGKAGGRVGGISTIEMSSKRRYGGGENGDKTQNEALLFDFG